MENLHMINGSLPESQNNARNGFGCVHLEQMLNKSAVTAEKLMVAFSDFQQSRTSSREKWRDELSTQEQGNETEQEAGFPLKLSSTLLRSTHRCLQCRHICTTREMKKHAIGKGHAFCASFRSGSVYCAICEDFVYDTELERMGNKIRSAVFEASKKRKADALVAPIEPTVSNPVSALGMPHGALLGGQAQSQS